LDKYYILGIKKLYSELKKERNITVALETMCNFYPTFDMGGIIYLRSAGLKAYKDYAYYYEPFYMKNEERLLK